MLRTPRPGDGACAFCEERARCWAALQERLLPAAEAAYARFLRQKKEILWSAHAEGRLFFRCLAKRDVLKALEDGVVVEAQGRTVLVFTSIRAGRAYRPLHVVLSLDAPGRATVVTVYDPRSEAWRWDASLTRRVCWCDREEVDALWA